MSGYYRKLISVLDGLAGEPWGLSPKIVFIMFRMMTETMIILSSQLISTIHQFRMLSLPLKFQVINTTSLVQNLEIL